LRQVSALGKEVRLQPQRFRTYVGLEPEETLECRQFLAQFSLIFR